MLQRNIIDLICKETWRQFNLLTDNGFSVKSLQLHKEHMHLYHSQYRYILFLPLVPPPNKKKKN